jgi:protein O-mannosyl-transferase
MTKKQQQKTPAKPEKGTPADKANNPNATPYLILAAILVLTWVVFAPALQNGFTNWDDNVYVTENKHIAWNMENRMEHLTKEVAGNFHPLTMWSLSLNHHSKGGKIDPLPYHRSNLLLHLLNVALTFFLVWRLGRSWAAAALVSLLFAIHPMHVESVAWVSGRKDVLYAAFFLLGLLAYLRAVDRRGTPAYSTWLGLTFVCFVLSCLAKPAAIVFPAVLWLLDWYRQPEGAWKPARFVPLLPFVAVSGLFAYLTVQYQRNVGALDETHFSFLQKTLFAAYGVVAYLFKMVFPTNLSAFHPVPDNWNALGANYYLALAASLGVLGYTVWVYRKGYREQFFALAFFFINLVLVLGFVRVGSAVYAERYTYLAYMGIFMALALAAERYWHQGVAQKAGIAAAFVLFSVFFAWKTQEQCRVWKNSETLWSQIVAAYPTEKTYSYRGYHYYLNGQMDKALADFDQAYQKNPNNETTLHIRGLCLQKANRFEDALQMFEEHDKQFSAKADVKIAAAECLSALKRNPEAAQRYTEALALDPKNLSTWTNASTVHFAMQDYAKTEECLSTALGMNPKYLPALRNRGATRMVMGKYAEAIEDLDKALEQDPNQPQLVDYRKRCYEKLKTGK